MRGGNRTVRTGKSCASSGPVRRERGGRPTRRGAGVDSAARARRRTCHTMSLARRGGTRMVGKNLCALRNGAAKGLGKCPAVQGSAPRLRRVPRGSGGRRAARAGRRSGGRPPAPRSARRPGRAPARRRRLRSRPPTPPRPGGSTPKSEDRSATWTRNVPAADSSMWMMADVRRRRRAPEACGARRVSAACRRSISARRRRPRRRWCRSGTAGPSGAAAVLRTARGGRADREAHRGRSGSGPNTRQQPFRGRSP